MGTILACIMVFVAGVAIGALAMKMLGSKVEDKINKL